MTVQKAIGLLENLDGMIEDNHKSDYDSAFKIAIKCMEEVEQYRALEQQGLLVKLTCKVGDVVYHEKKYATIHTGIQSYQITNIMISQNKKGEWTKKYRAMFLLNGKIVDSQLNFSFDEIGKTVFLTKEEAEAKLKEMG